MKWKPEEYEFILNNYLTKPQQEMANILGRSLDSIKQHMSRNGITLPEDIRSLRFKKANEKMRKQLGGMKGANNPNWKGGRSTDNYYYKLRQMKRFPERVKAREIFYQEIRSGRIKRQPCEVCGDQNGHAHHEDYNKPLEVIWLCRKHHLQRHRS